MLSNFRTLMRLTAVASVALFTSVSLSAQELQRDYDSNDENGNYQEQSSGARVDRYLDADVWVDRSEGEYYEGDDITISYRASRDAFIAIYTVDTRGRVNLLFPTSPADDNYVSGGMTYSLPGRGDDYDLEVSGPEGREYIQIIASREKFPIPNWYGNSGIVCDLDNPEDFIDELNDRQFVRYPGQRFAYDRAVIFVNEWEQEYYRPIYWPTYPNWSVCGNVYIDYPYGGTVYINGVYWGCAPLYIPRVLVGWHTITVYDPWGYCWESDFHVSRYHTMVLDNHVIRPNQITVSKYKEVRTVGYRAPERNGYTNFKSKVTVDVKSASPGKTQLRADKSTRTDVVTSAAPLAKKYARGSSSVVKTDRGYETIPENGTDSYSGSTGKKSSSGAQSGYRTNRDYSGSVGSGKKSSGRTSGGEVNTGGTSQGNTSNGGSSTYSGKKSSSGSGGSSSNNGAVSVGKKSTPKSGGEAKPAEPKTQPESGGYKKGNEGTSAPKAAPQSSGKNGGQTTSGGKKRP